MQRTAITAAILIATLIANVRAPAEDAKPADEKAAPKMLLRVFYINPNAAGFVDYTDASGKTHIGSYLVAIPGVSDVCDTAGFLKAQGIPFPPGSQALYDKRQGFLAVVNSVENLYAVESLFDGDWSPLNLLDIELSTLECSLPPDEAIRSLPYEKLTSLGGKSIRLLDHVSIVSRGGSESTVSHLSSEKPGPSAEFKEEADGNLFFDPHQSGTRVKIQPNVHTDEKTIETNILYRSRQKVEGKIADVKFRTTFSATDGIPMILHVSPIPGTRGKFVVVVATAHLTNVGGWKLKAEREARKFESK